MGKSAQLAQNPAILVLGALLKPNPPRTRGRVAALLGSVVAQVRCNPQELTWHKWDPPNERFLFLERLLQLGSDKFWMAKRGSQNLQTLLVWEALQNLSKLLVQDQQPEQTLSNTSQMAGFRSATFHPPSILMLECTHMFS